MLGWHITIYRQEKGGDAPASFEEPTGMTLAVWQAGLWGLGWINELVEAGHAVCLGGNGYPLKYTAQVEQVRATVLEGPPHANQTWRYDEGDILTEGWLGKTTIDVHSLCECQPEEWILIVAWDES